MKKRAVGILIAGMVMASITGCGTKAQATSVNTVTEVSTSTMQNEPIKGTDVEETNSNIESEVETVEPVYTDYEDLYLADNYLKVGREKLEAVDTDSLEKTYEDYVLSDSTDLYNFEGTWVGYSKPDIKVTLFGMNDDWAEISFIKTVLYIPRDKFNAIAALSDEELETEEILLAEAEETAPKQETTLVQEKPKTETPKTETPTTSEPVVAEPSVTQPVVEPEPVVDNTKYTPEEAIAVYRSIMEANGIAWNPSLKNGGSWGTGWIYLDKGYAEWAGNSSVESFRMGGGDSTNPWDCYYLEVTGSDENAVYYTKWHP